MKRQGGDLFDRIVDKDNLLLAHKNARKGKAHYTQVKWVNANLDLAIDEIHTMLVNGTFTTSEYEIEEGMRGGKWRVLHKLPYYPDRIVQHAIIQQCGEVWKRHMIRDTFQSIKGRGTADCIKRVKRAVQRERPRFAIKLDIVKFYQSIKNKYLLLHEILRIKCKRTFALLKDIICSLPGVPLGNFTSQFCGNLILSPLDWFCKQILKIKYYFRYCDDIVIMGNSKDQLLEWREAISEHLRQFELKLKNRVNIIDLSKESLSFVGVKFMHTKIKLRENISTGFKARIRRHNHKSIPSYYGWCKYAGAMKLFYKYVSPSGCWRRTVRVEI